MFSRITSNELIIKEIQHLKFLGLSLYLLCCFVAAVRLEDGDGHRRLSAKVSEKDFNNTSECLKRNKNSETGNFADSTCHLTV
jgi:hypothetical protein